MIAGGGRSWSLEARPGGVTVRSLLAVAAADVSERTTLVEGEPAELLLWLWGRVGDRSVRQVGDPALLEQLLALRKKATQ